MVLDAFTALRAAFIKRFESLEARVPDMLHGIVEAVNPVSVRLLDGSLVVGLDTLDPTVEVTDRVRLIAYGGFLTGRRLLVLGKVGGQAWPKPRRMTMSDTLGIPTAQDFRTDYWSGAWNDGGDSGGIYYSNGGFEVSQTGVYTVSISTRWTATFSAIAELKLYQGADIDNMLEREVIEFVNQQSMHASFTIPMEVGSTGRVEVRLRQVSGTTRNIGIYSNPNWYQIARVG